MATGGSNKPPGPGEEQPESQMGSSIQPTNFATDSDPATQTVKGGKNIGAVGENLEAASKGDKAANDKVGKNTGEGVGRVIGGVAGRNGMTSELGGQIGGTVGDVANKTGVTEQVTKGIGQIEEKTGIPITKVAGVAGKAVTQVSEVAGTVTDIKKGFSAKGGAQGGLAQGMQGMGQDKSNPTEGLTSMTQGMGQDKSNPAEGLTSMTQGMGQGKSNPAEGLTSMTQGMGQGKSNPADTATESLGTKSGSPINAVSPDKMMEGGPSSKLTDALGGASSGGKDDKKESDNPGENLMQQLSTIMNTLNEGVKMLSKGMESLSSGIGMGNENKQNGPSMPSPKFGGEENKQGGAAIVPKMDTIAKDNPMENKNSFKGIGNIPNPMDGGKPAPKSQEPEQDKKTKLR